MNPNSLWLKVAIIASIGETLAFVSTPSNVAAASSTRLMASESNTRRTFLGNFGTIAGIVSLPTITQALDFDAFEKGLVESDTKNCNPKLDPKCIPKLTPDEALCQYGKSGQARGEACMRVKQAGGKLPGVTKEKSLGGAYAM
jgi:hypothetical protein